MNESKEAAAYPEGTVLQHESDGYFIRVGSYRWMDRWGGTWGWIAGEIVFQPVAKPQVGDILASREAVLNLPDLTVVVAQPTYPRKGDGVVGIKWGKEVQIVGGSDFEAVSDGVAWKIVHLNEPG